jgi:hypothetical protein
MEEACVASVADCGDFGRSGQDHREEVAEAVRVGQPIRTPPANAGLLLHTCILHA